MQTGSAMAWLRTYLALGALWSVLTNVHAGMTGAPSALVAASGPSTGIAKAIGIAVVLVRQVSLWPVDLWEKVLRPLF